MYKVTISIPEGTQMSGRPAPTDMSFVLRTDDQQAAEAKGQSVANTIKGGLYPKNVELTVAVEAVN